MVVAVGRRNWQTVLEQLDAVLVVVDRIEIGAAAREEQFVVPIGTFREHAGDEAQHVGEVGDVPSIQLSALHDGDGAGCQRALRFHLRLQPLGRHEDTLFQGLHSQTEVCDCLRPRGRESHLPFGGLETWRRDPDRVCTRLRIVEPVSAVAVGDDGTNYDEAAREFNLRAGDRSTRLVRDESADSRDLLSSAQGGCSDGEQGNGKDNEAVG